MSFLHRIPFWYFFLITVSPLISVYKGRVVDYFIPRIIEILCCESPFPQVFCLCPDWHLLVSHILWHALYFQIWWRICKCAHTGATAARESIMWNMEHSKVTNRRLYFCGTMWHTYETFKFPRRKDTPLFFIFFFSLRDRKSVV